MENNNDHNHSEAPHFIQERRKLLQIASDQYENRLKGQVQEMGDSIRKNAANWGKNALIMGGTLWLSYRLLKGMTGGKAKKKKKREIIDPATLKLDTKRYNRRNSRKSALLNSIKQNIALFLLKSAQRRLMQYLEQQGQLDEEHAVQFIDTEKKRRS